MATKSKSRFESLSVNVPVQLVNKIDDQVEANAPFAKRHSVHLAALTMCWGFVIGR